MPNERVKRVLQAASDAATPVLLINAFAVPEPRDAEFTARWEGIAHTLGRCDGFERSVLHVSLRSDAPYRYLNVAHWQSVAQLQRALSGLRGDGTAPGALEDYRPATELYRAVRAVEPGAR